MPKVWVKGRDNPENYTGSIEEAKKALDEKYKQLKDFATKAWGGMSPFDKAALATAPIPVVGDITGLMADADMFINDPESRTLLNAGLSAAGLIPFVPALSTTRKAVEAGAKVADDLPMDEASRMARAKDMGFDVDQTYYHGGSEVREKFDIDPTGRLYSEDIGAFFDSDIDVTEIYGPAVTKANLNINPYIVDLSNEDSIYKALDIDPTKLSEEKLMRLDYEISSMNRSDFRDRYREKLQEKALGGDYDSIKIIDQDEGELIQVFDPEKIRSIDAKFDPSKAASSNLLAGGAAATAGTSAYMARSEEEKVD